MHVTTIKSTQGQVALSNIRPTGANPALTHIDVSVRGVQACAAFRTADILAALDATANADVKHRADAYADATRAESERDEWKARAEDAEAFGGAAVKRAEEAEAEALEQAKLVRTWADRADRAEEGLGEMRDAYRMLGASHALLLSERDEQRARAEKAEATVARVREATAIWGDRFRPAVLAALDPTPAFTLPTEAGVRFVATHKATGSQSVFKTFDGGTETAYIHNAGTYWVAEDLLRDFEDFRLIGADQ